MSATSTTYIFAFKTASSGSIKRVEITAPAGYGVAGATLTGSSLALQLGTLTVSGQTMRLTLPFAIPTSAGNQLSLQISGIDNPSSVGPHTFDFATKNNAGGTIDSGNAAITLTDSGVAPGSVGTDQIQDGAVTFDKLAADVLAYFTDLIDALRTELLAIINAEAAARQAADQLLQNNIDAEAAARAAADANLQGQIDALDARLDALEGGGPDPNDVDDDSDGFTENEGDCDDSNEDVNPSSPEVVNGIDDDCDGTIDNLPAADAFEPNESPIQATDLGDAVQDVNSISIDANMHLTSDEDWYIFDAVEVGGLALTDDLNIEIALTNIPAGSNYDLFASCPTCTGSTFASSTNSDNADESISSLQLFTLDGNGSDDSVALQIEVRNVSDTASANEYTLTITVT